MLKTQTRRVAKFKPRSPGLNMGFSGLVSGCYCTDVQRTGWVLRSRGAGGCWNDRTFPLKCRYGVPGDRIWVREAYAKAGGYYRYPATDDVHELRKIIPPHLMPRAASRLILEVLQVRVERLWNITDEEAKAEGVPRANPEIELLGEYRIGFQAGWDLLNANRGFPWASNPWVFAVDFKLA